MRILLRLVAGKTLTPYAGRSRMVTAMLALQNLEVLTVGSRADNLGSSLKINSSELGALFGIYTFFYAIVQIPVGLAFARCSPTKLLAVACTIFALGNIFSHHPIPC